ncbi:ABC transporter ATP-binding protein [Kineosporia sp. NBRC 101731]|uniref:ABC transporter ATP-binding protein n=1 Tax=Kineosporia sp. NBRC 101731 TaxID=3032199 RepID=UPI00249FBBFD|nr:ABC transporter ATP-binding protein [Kineosporia sp. NBRC 101731]GLY29107.1 ABC transporter ATP-binding protein [Kineosporia sp. NBRC 101731]
MTFSQLRLENVGRRFAGTDALQHLDLTIQQGEFIALLGPSGCGKSTALNCLAGLLPLSSGRIWLDEQRIDVLAPERRGFGMVFQNYALFPHLTVRRNIEFGLRMRRLPKPEIARRATQALELVHLEDQAGKLPGQLSGGQQQRVAIARAVALEPSVVLMDEPLSNLDAKLRLEMRTEIRRLHQSLGLTTIYVTHDQEEALSMADRLVVLRQGQVQQIGTPEELHSQPLSWPVADFMGCRNLFAGSLITSAADRGETAMVDVLGLRIEGTAAARVETPDAVAVGIRPEDIEVAPVSGPHTVDATVSVVEYQGREFAVEALTGPGLRLHIRTTARLVPGDPVALRLPPERLLVFPGGADLPRPVAPLGEEITPDLPADAGAPA